MGANASAVSEQLTVEEELALIIEYFHSRRMTIQDAFALLDVDRNGYVAWDEFLRGVRHCIDGTGHAAAANPANLLPVFQRFDVNNDGFLSIEEFAAAFSSQRVQVQSTHYDEFEYRGLSAAPGSSSSWSTTGSKVVEDVIARIASSLVRIGSTPQDLFARLDGDHNGRLSWLELEAVILGLEPHLSLSEKEAIWQRFDKDGSGLVDLNEFYEALQQVNAGALVAVEDKVKFMGTKFRQLGYNVQEAFAVFDRDFDGFLSREEWQRAMSLLGPELGPNDVEAVFRRFDVNGDGFMHISEFQDFFQNALDLRATAPPTWSAGLPVYVPPPVEAPWEADVLDLVRQCLSPQRTGMASAEVFRRLDITNSNTMTQYEFNRMLASYRSDVTAEQQDQLFYKVNTSRTGAITLGEFVRRFG